MSKSLLKDKAQIKIASGKGGRGSTAFFRKRPSGGDGGAGGDVYFKGSRDLYDLRRFKHNVRYKAEDGDGGQTRGRDGADADDMYINVPLVTEIELDNGEKYKVSEHGETVKVLEGGKGSYGNVTLRKRDDILNKDNVARRKNETATAYLTLKLQSDIIFIGYPNAGKSSLLNQLTNAKAKIAPYEFTTIDPQIGIMNGLRLMDLPGLIQGTYKGKGVGKKFLKHTENSKVVAHFVSLDREKPFERYISMREEIAKLDTKLAARPEIVLLSKRDEIIEREMVNLEETFRKRTEAVRVISYTIIDDADIKKIEKTFQEVFKQITD